jgi:hypothetical protein
MCLQFFSHEGKVNWQNNIIVSVNKKSYPWLIITGFGLDDWIYRDFYYNYNQLKQLIINECLRSAPFLTGIRASFFQCDWLGSDLRIGHFFSFRCPLVNTPQLNTPLLNYLTTKWQATHDWTRTESFCQESESELIYDWRFTANQFVSAPSPLNRSSLHGSLWSLPVTMENVCFLPVVTETRLVLNWSVGIDFRSNVCQFRVYSFPRERTYRAAVQQWSYSLQYYSITVSYYHSM